MKHTLLADCPCSDCARERFGDRAALFIIAGLVSIAGLAWLAVWL